MKIVEPETVAPSVAALSESEAEMVRKCRRALAKGRPQRGWWSTEDGLRALTYLRGWGAVVRERRATGDPAAYPRSDGTAGAGQRSIDSQPKIVMDHDTVESWVKTLTQQQASLLAWVYVHQTEERSLLVIYQFEDGSKSDILPATDPEPAQYERMHTLASGYVQRTPLSKLKMPAVERLFQALGAAELWQALAPEILECIHELMGRNLIEFLNR